MTIPDFVKTGIKVDATKVPDMCGTVAPNTFSKAPTQFDADFLWPFEQPRALYMKDGLYNVEVSIQINRVEESWFRSLLKRASVMLPKEVDVKLPTYTTKTGRTYLNLKFKRDSLLQLNGDFVGKEEFIDKMSTGSINNGSTATYKPVTELLLEPYVWVKHDGDNLPSLSMTLYLKQVKA